MRFSYCPSLFFCQIYWLFDGEPITNVANSQRYQQHVLGDTYSLTINDIQYEDAGRFTLNAENSWGKATCTAQLFIPPTSISGKINSPHTNLNRSEELSFLLVLFFFCLTNLTKTVFIDNKRSTSSDNIIASKYSHIQSLVLNQLLQLLGNQLALYSPASNWYRTYLFP